MSLYGESFHLNYCSKNSLFISMLASIIVFILLSISSLSQAETIYFSDDFESGNFSKWASRNPNVTIQSDRVHKGTKAIHIPYDLEAIGPDHQDNNRHVIADLTSKNLSHFFLHGCFNISSSVAPPRVYSPTTRRKLFYIFSEDYYRQGRWDIILGALGGEKGKTGDIYPLSITIGSNYYPNYSDLRTGASFASGLIKVDQWHCLELEAKLNTPNVSDGLVRVWLDGVLVYERLNISIRSDNRALGVIQVGTQIDRSGDSEERHEDRYWDDIIISDTINSSLRPSPPTQVNAQQE